jgi:large subunit ribosomal protein L6
MNKVETLTKKKYVLQVQNNIEVFYCNQKKIILFKGSIKQKSLKIHNFLKINCFEKKIQLTIDHSKKLSNLNKKKRKIIQNTTLSLIKQLLIESTTIIYQKLKFIGVGYRAFPVKNFENQLIILKLGYSHPLYFKIPLKVKIFSLKFTTLFLSSYSYQALTLSAAKIRLNKVPEPYKGKGILYDNEKIQLKEGKKI